MLEALTLDYQHNITVVCNMSVLTGGHFSDGTRYGAAQVEAFVKNRYGILGAAFLHSAITKDIRNLVSGKRVLDIGCGAGNWCLTAAQYGAKSVDGFDIQPEMVELAKQATSHLDMIHIQVGDAADMPYDDDSFDVAISLFVACNLSSEVCLKHFKQLYRVLAPGGKAVLLVHTDWSHSKLYTKKKVGPAAVEYSVAQILRRLPKYPNTAQVAEAFRHTDDILTICFALDKTGSIFYVTNTNQLTDGQPIWRKSEMMTYPNFFYSERMITTELLSNGFNIDTTENPYTKEMLTIYNSSNPMNILGSEYVTYPTALIHLVSKPLHCLNP